MNQTPEELARKIEEARAREEAKRPRRAVDSSNATGQAFRAATDLVAGVMVGLFIGYWIDKWLNSAPWGLLVMLILGFAAGLLNIYRMQTGQEFKIGFKKEKKDDNGSQSP
jgi:ATP synthase protein I